MQYGNENIYRGGTVMKKHEFKVSTGITSIMMIFVVLCLTAFGVLSYSSANADIKLSVKNADSIAEYYQAESLINEEICCIDGIILKVRQEGLKEDDYYKAVKEEIDKAYGENTYNQENNTVTLKEEISGSRKLYVILKITDDNTQQRYSMEDFRVITE